MREAADKLNEHIFDEKLLYKRSDKTRKKWADAASQLNRMAERIELGLTPAQIRAARDRVLFGPRQEEQEQETQSVEQTRRAAARERREKERELNYAMDFGAEPEESSASSASGAAWDESTESAWEKWKREAQQRQAQQQPAAKPGGQTVRLQVNQEAIKLRKDLDEAIYDFETAPLNSGIKRRAQRKVERLRQLLAEAIANPEDRSGLAIGKKPEKDPDDDTGDQIRDKDDSLGAQTQLRPTDPDVVADYEYYIQNPELISTVRQSDDQDAGEYAQETSEEMRTRQKRQGRGSKRRKGKKGPPPEQGGMDFGGGASPGGGPVRPQRPRTPSFGGGGRRGGATPGGRMFRPKLPGK